MSRTPTPVDLPADAYDALAAIAVDAVLAAHSQVTLTDDSEAPPSRDWLIGHVAMMMSRHSGTAV